MKTNISAQNYRYVRERETCMRSKYEMRSSFQFQNMRLLGKQSDREH